jgi:hypothetical protein
MCVFDEPSYCVGGVVIATDSDVLSEDVPVSVIDTRTIGMTLDSV